MGRQKAVRNPVLMDRDGPQIMRPAPLLGEHTADVLHELGYDDARIAALAEAGTVMVGKRAGA
jgi:formyl-CoA transferase